MFNTRMIRESGIQIRFGSYLRKLRKEKGLSQEAFSALCGLDRNYIGSIERGERNVALRNIEVIAKGLDLTLSELMQGVESEGGDG